MGIKVGLVRQRRTQEVAELVSKHQKTGYKSSDWKGINPFPVPFQKEPEKPPFPPRPNTPEQQEKAIEVLRIAAEKLRCSSR